MNSLFFRLKKRAAFVIVWGPIFSCFVPLFAQNQPVTQEVPASVQKASLYADVANLYLKSFNVVEPQNVGPSVDELLKKGEKIELRKQELSPAQQRHLALNALVRGSIHKDAKLEGVIDLSFVKKMELLAGQENSQVSLFSTINRTKTVFGEAVLVRMLVTPTADMQELKRRQAIIQELVTNEQLFKQLDVALDEIKTAQAHLFGFWEEEGQANKYLLNQVYFSTWGFNWLNDSACALEARTRLASLFNLPIYLEPYMVATMPLSEAFNNMSHSDSQLTFKQAYAQELKKSYSMVKGIFSPRLRASKGVNSERDFINKCRKVYLGELESTELDPISLRDYWRVIGYVPEKNLRLSSANIKMGIVGMAAIYAAYKAWGIYSFLCDEKKKNQISTYVQDKMIGVAGAIRGMKKSYALARANEQLDGIMVLESLAQLQGSSKNSAQFNKLLGMLDHNTFTGKPSFFSVTGRVLASYKVMQDVKDEFIQSLEAAGELDAYLSMAKLVKEHERKRVGYSFVHFVEREKPMVQAVNFWNPFISPDVVVPNNITLGIDNQPGNVVITGPNTGGKSTVIKGVLLALVLAQSFGIAPVQELTMTPFAKLNCHLNITDDIAAGTSLFKAEVLKAKELITGVRTLKANEFSCTAMDEAFNGTEPKAGAEASYKFSEQLASSDNSLVLLATHFPELTKLEQTNRFRNLQVKVIKHDDGSLERPFKLEPGISTLNIALDLLREEGVLQ